jgi:hypothetical protein
MKKIFLTLLSLSLFTIALAQKSLPEIKNGTILSSRGYISGQEFRLTLTVNSVSAPVSIGWAVEGYGEGTFEISDKALESATKMFGGSHPAQGVTKLKDDETFGLISKAAYRTLIDTKALTYNGIKFNVKSPSPVPVKIGGKEADVTHVISEDGKLEFWILNNPAFPLIVQSAGMPIDIAVYDIK